MVKVLGVDTVASAIGAVGFIGGDEACFAGIAHSGVVWDGAVRAKKSPALWFDCVSACVWVV